MKPFATETQTDRATARYAAGFSTNDRRPLIYVVDDETQVCDHIAELLRPLYEVACFDGAAICLSQINNNVPDLVLTDVVMPEMDGFMLLRKIRQNTILRAVPVILITGMVDEEGRHKALEAGANDYLLKPFSPRELLARVTTHMEIAKYRRDSLNRERELRSLAEAARSEILGILNSITDGFILVDSDWKFTYLNKVAESMLSLECLNVKGKCFWEHTVKRLPESFFKILQESAKEKKGVDSEFEFPDLNQWVEIKSFPSPDGFALYLRDTTHRRHVEEIRGTLAAIVASSDDAILGISLDGKVSSWNAGAVRMFGYNPGEVIGKPLFFLSPPYRTNDLPSLLTSVASGNRIQHFETERVTKDGRRLFVSLSVSPIRNEEGKLIGMSEIARDMTERRITENALRTETEFRKAIEASIPSGISAVDNKGRQIYVNRAFCQMVGWKESELVGLQPPFPYWPVDELDSITEAIRLTKEGKTPPGGYELKFNRKDGTRIEVLLNITPMLDNMGQTAGWLSSVYDITERRQTEISALERYVQIQQVYELVDQANHANELQEIYNVALDASILLLKADRAALLLEDPKSGRMKFAAWRGLSDNYRKEVEGHSPWAKDQATFEPIFISDIEGQFDNHIHAVLKQEGIKGVSFLPLVYQGRLLGKFMLYHNVAHEFPSENRRLAQTIGRQIAFSIGRKQAEDALKEGEEALRSSEEQIRLITNQLPHLISFIDKDMIYRFNNAAYETWFARPLSQITGHSLQNVLPPKILELFEPHLREALSGRELIHEDWITSVDNQRRYMRAHYLPRRNIQGEVDGIITVVADETNRKLDEQEKDRLTSLVFSHRKRLLDIVANLPGIVWEGEGNPAEDNYRITFVSSYAEKMLGYTTDEWLNTPQFWARIMHAEDRAGALRRAQENFSTRGGRNIFRWITRDGRTLWIESTAVVVMDEKAVPTGMRGVAMDITDRRQREQERLELLEQLELERSRLEGLLQHMPAGVLVAEAPTGRIIFGNRQCEDILGGPIVSSQSIKDYALWPCLHSDGRRYEVNDLPMARAILNGEAVRDEEMEFAREDGTQITLSVNASPIYNREGKITTGVITFHDISERKQAEKIQAFLVELGDKLNLFMPPESILQTATLETCEFIGLHRCFFAELNNKQFNVVADYCMGKRMLNGKHNFDASTLPIYEELRKGVTVVVQDVLHDERVKTLRKWKDIGAMVVVPLPQEGKLWTFVGISSGPRIWKPGELRLMETVAERAWLAVRHITLYEEAQAARADAEAANSAKDQFLAVLSHELRTPLTPVLMSVSMLNSNEEIPNKYKPTLDMIQRNVQMEARLIDDLLDLSRITHNKLELNLEVDDIHKSIERALNICRTDMETKNLQVEVRLEANPSLVMADSARLQQVFWNLIKNAVKFTPIEGQLKIRSFNQEKLIVIEVADTGIGIEPQMLPKIFDPFEQGAIAMSPKFGGLGLGLAISKAIIDTHGGKLSAKSGGINRGSIFRLELPGVEPTHGMS